MVDAGPELEVVFLEVMGAMELPVGGKGVTTTSDGRGPPVSPPEDGMVELVVAVGLLVVMVGLVVVLLP